MLGHPHVVPILDQGTASAPTAWGSLGRIAEGSAWIAMPLARRSLHELCGRIPWEAARTVLLAVLDALATAHAHGLLHLDVKPANILVDGDGPPYLAMLADFGLARPEREGDRSMAGTPDYMAPEQFRRARRELGPWTDLYALGATAVTLVQGWPPFDASSSSELASAHLQAPLPPLAPAIDVPHGLQGWLTRMWPRTPSTATRPRRRPRRPWRSWDPRRPAPGPVPRRCSTPSAPSSGGTSTSTPSRSRAPRTGRVPTGPTSPTTRGRAASATAATAATATAATAGALLLAAPLPVRRPLVVVGGLLDFGLGLGGLGARLGADQPAAAQREEEREDRYGDGQRTLHVPSRRDGTWWFFGLGWSPGISCG